MELLSIMSACVGMTLVFMSLIANSVLLLGTGVLLLMLGGFLFFASQDEDYQDWQDRDGR